MSTAPIIPGWAIDDETGTVLDAAIWHVHQQGGGPTLGGDVFGGGAIVESRRGMLLLARSPGALAPQVATRVPGLSPVHDSGQVATPAGRRSWIIVDRWSQPLTARSGPLDDVAVQSLLDALAALHASGIVHGRIGPDAVVFQTGAWRLLPPVVSSPAHPHEDVQALVSILSSRATPAWAQRWALRGGAGALAAGIDEPDTPDLPLLSTSGAQRLARTTKRPPAGWSASVSLLARPVIPGVYPPGLLAASLASTVPVLDDPVPVTAAPGQRVAVVFSQDDLSVVGPARVIGEAADISGLTAWFSDGQIHVRWTWPPPSAAGIQAVGTVLLADNPRGDGAQEVRSIARATMAQQGSVISIRPSTPAPWWLGVVHEERTPGKTPRRSGGVWIQVLPQARALYSIVPGEFSCRSEDVDCLPAFDLVLGPGRPPTTRTDGVIVHSQPAGPESRIRVDLAISRAEVAHLRPFPRPDHRHDWTFIPDDP